MLAVALLLPFAVFAGPPSGGSNGCFPPPQVVNDDPSTCGSQSRNPNYSCSGATFTRSSGFWWGCSAHTDCYESREPNEWCHLPPLFDWTEKGCFCDQKLGSCIIERASPNERQWAYCMPKEQFICDTPNGKCAQ